MVSLMAASAACNLGKQLPSGTQCTHSASCSAHHSATELHACLKTDSRAQARSPHPSMCACDLCPMLGASSTVWCVARPVAAGSHQPVDVGHDLCRHSSAKLANLQHRRRSWAKHEVRHTFETRLKVRSTGDCLETADPTAWHLHRVCISHQ